MVDKNGEVNEAQEAYHTSHSNNKTLTFFSSFEEAKDFSRRKMAAMDPAQRLEALEQLRKQFLSNYLLPNGKWPPIDRVISIKKGALK